MDSFFQSGSFKVFVLFLGVEIVWMLSIPRQDISDYCPMITCMLVIALAILFTGRLLHGIREVSSPEFQKKQREKYEKEDEDEDDEDDYSDY